MAVHASLEIKADGCHVPRTKQALEGNEQTKAKTSWEPKSSSNTTLICRTSKLFFPLAFCSARESFSPLGHSLSPFKKILPWVAGCFYILETSFSADFSLGSEARHGTPYRGNKRTACSGTKQTAETRNYNHKLCRAAINTRQTTVTHPRGQCSRSQSYASELKPKLNHSFFLSLLLHLVYMGTEHCMSSFFLKRNSPCCLSSSGISDRIFLLAS